MKKSAIYLTSIVVACLTSPLYAEEKAENKFVQVVKSVAVAAGGSINVQAADYNKAVNLTSNNNTGGGQYGQWMKVDGGLNGNAQIATAPNINLNMNNGNGTEQDFQHMETNSIGSLNGQYLTADTATMNMKNSIGSTQSLQSMKVGQ